MKRTKYYYYIKIQDGINGQIKQIRVTSYSFVEAQAQIINDLLELGENSLNWRIVNVSEPIHKASADRKEKMNKRRARLKAMNQEKLGRVYIDIHADKYDKD